ALAQCEHFFAAHPKWKHMPAEDTASSMREAISAKNPSRAAIAERRTTEHYRATILAKRIQDNTENFTHFVLLVPEKEAASWLSNEARKTSLAMHLAHRPGALLASLEPFANHRINLLKIESRPIHDRPW